jgi:hypothetical protein
MRMAVMMMQTNQKDELQAKLIEKGSQTKMLSFDDVLADGLPHGSGH